MQRLYHDDPLGPLYIVTEKFDAGRGEDWTKYIAWSGLPQVSEIVSLDSMLCEPVVDGPTDGDWSSIVNENFMLDYHTNLPYLLEQAGTTAGRNVLCVYRNPPAPPQPPPGFIFVGHDIVDVLGGVSALVNCGGFPKAFSNQELSRFGLIDSYDRAFQIQRSLREEYPDGEHSNCHVFAVFRRDDP